MKVIEDILREVDLEVLRKAPHAQRKYNKITESLRTRFLTKIFNENKSIKKAAEELNINYSSAKTILTMHRKKLRASGSSADLLSLAEESQDKALPPKNSIKQSFLSTASNLSEMKDSEESSEDNHHEELHKLSSFAKISKNVVLVQPPRQNNVFPQQQQEQPQIAQSQVPAISPAMMAQIQQQIQAQQQQQQQQQLQNTLQQLILLQNAVLVQQQSQSNPLAQLLLQQQLMMLNPLAPSQLNLPNWI